MLEKWKDFFRKKEWDRGFSLGKKKMKELLERVKKDKKESVNLEALEVLEFYGLPVARYRVVRSRDDIYRVAEELGYPLVLKAVTSRVIHKGDAGAVAVGVYKEDIVKAYPSILGEVATRMPWLTLEGVLVQEMVEGEERWEVKLERDRKKPFPFRWMARVFKKGEDKPRERARDVENEEGILELLPRGPWEEVYEGMWALWLQYPQVRKMEVDLLYTPGESPESPLSPPRVVDAKLFFFEL